MIAPASSSSFQTSLRTSRINDSDPIDCFQTSLRTSRINDSDPIDFSTKYIKNQISGKQIQIKEKSKIIS